MQGNFDAGNCGAGELWCRGTLVQAGQIHDEGERTIN